MKISFGPNEKEGYINFGINYESFVKEVDDGECIDIHALEILDYIPEHKFNDFVTNLVKKMRHGCILTIGGSDVYESAKHILRGDYDIHGINKLLYGQQDIYRKGQYSLNIVSDILINKNIKILEKDIVGNQMYVKGVRE